MPEEPGFRSQHFVYSSEYAELRCRSRAGDVCPVLQTLFILIWSLILYSLFVSFWQEIAKPIIGLSPMDGVTDASFRFITSKYGPPDVTFTEFVSVETAFYAPRTLIRDMAYSELERPVIAQVYGHTPEMFYKVAHVVCELGFDGLDINMGCPAKKVAAKGSGAALIRNPKLAQAIIRTVRQAIEDWCDGQTLSDVKIHPELIELVRSAKQLRVGADYSPVRRAIPVSVKTRIGYDRIVVEDWMETLLEEKLSAITVHGRTLQQQYRGCADWDAIARAVEVARGSETLMLGNGDLRDMKDILRRVRETGVAGVLLGRAAQGDPWIFRTKDQVKHALMRGEAINSAPPQIPLTERLSALLEHAAHFEHHSGASAFVAMRKHLAWYCRCIPNAAALRAKLVRLNTRAELLRCLDDYVLGLVRGGSSADCAFVGPTPPESASAASTSCD
jgi:nifR3 family TIM-barrel protein